MAPHTTEACDWLICVFNQGLAFLSAVLSRLEDLERKTVLDCKIQLYRFWRAHVKYRAGYFHNKSGVQPWKALQY